MFKIKWRNREYGWGRSMHPIIEGISRYRTRELAINQVVKWTTIFPQNTYYIELSSN